MGKPDYKPDYKIGKLFFLFAIMGAIALPIIIFQAFSVNTGEALAKVNVAPVEDFDHGGKQLFAIYNGTTPAYMDGTSTSRTLNYYYSLRQYPGSPPFIPHDPVVEKGVEQACLSCHEQGGFVQAFNRFTPVTPHPQHTYCGQCHMTTVTETLFKENDWVSVQVPKLGRSALPGSPSHRTPASDERKLYCMPCRTRNRGSHTCGASHEGQLSAMPSPEKTKALFTRTPY